MREHACVDPAALDGAWDEVERELRAGGHALLLADYEWGAKLLHAGDEAFAADDRAALRVLVFRDLARLSKDEADAGLAQREGRETRRCSR